ncbi:MAG: Ser/Thr protein kinase RdoA (MazF antagonist) [Saprospiraceae bacterium]|jgi:Ser/Thr protein kinase RdoA (MazF antagonist)
MDEMDFITIIRYAWMEYDPSRAIKSIIDISAKVSTNHVYKITLVNKTIIIAKLSYFGKYDDFVEDHTIINVLSNNLTYPYESVLSRSFMKGNDLFVHRFKNDVVDAAVVFYRPVKVKTRPPKRFNEEQIIKLGREFARFHKACHAVRYTLPKSSKSLRMDVLQLKQRVELSPADTYSEQHRELIINHCDTFVAEANRIRPKKSDFIPVFIDWNIGNFSITPSFRIYSRWDYDWFRNTTRVLDFYFLSRVVSDAGDMTAFTYEVDTLKNERFRLFLKSYHEVFPLTRAEVFMIKEGYRFFLLNYVLKHGTYFFNDRYATKLQKDVLDIHLSSIDGFDPGVIIKELGI